MTINTQLDTTLQKLVLDILTFQSQHTLFAGDVGKFNTLFDQTFGVIRLRHERFCGNLESTEEVSDREFDQHGKQGADHHNQQGRDINKTIAIMMIPIAPSKPIRVARSMYCYSVNGTLEIHIRYIAVIEGFLNERVARREIPYKPE